MNATGRFASQMNGRSTHEIWLPRNRFTASHASSTFSPVRALPDHCRSNGSSRTLPMIPANATNTRERQLQHRVFGRFQGRPRASGGVLYTMNSATGLSAPSTIDVTAKLISTAAND